MQLPEKAIKDDLIDRSKQMFMYFCKLFMYEKSKDKELWIQEVWSSLHDVAEIIETNKLPNESFIYSAITSYSTDELVLAAADYDETKIPASTDKVKIHNKILQYARWLSKQLAASGFVTSKAAEQYVENLVM